MWTDRKVAPAWPIAKIAVRRERFLPDKVDRVGNISENPQIAEGSEWRLVNGCRATGSDLSAYRAQPGDNRGTTGWDRRGYLSRRSGTGRSSACPRARRCGAVPRHLEGAAARRDPANPQCSAIAVYRRWRRLGADPRSAVGIADCRE